MRLTSPSTSAANPNTAPDCMHSTVFLPTTERGRVSSTRRNAADRAAAASEDTCTPGAIAPPRNSPLAETTSTQIDEPKSTTIAAELYLWKAARQLTIRSAPTSLGLSTRSGMPVRTPGSISTCGTDGQYCSSISRTSCSTDGTVDSPAAPVRRSESSPIRPMTVWVLRTSIARSTGLPRRHQLGRIGRHVGGVVTQVDLLVVDVDEHH